MKEVLTLAMRDLENAEIATNSTYESTMLIREALAQPEQEPVATVTSESGNPNVTMSWWHEPALPVGTNIYTTPTEAPVGKPWVSLTYEEISEIEDEYIVDYRIPAGSAWNFAQDIEAKLKEKNT